MVFFKSKGLKFSRLAWLLIAGLSLLPVILIAVGLLLVKLDCIPAPEVGTIYVTVLAVYFVGTALYALVSNRVPQRLFRGALGTCRATKFDIRWLRLTITILILATAATLFIHQLNWLCLSGVAAIGVLLSIYFGHLLLLRLQCSLLELLAITTTFGLIDGLVLSTPGALKLGLYLSPTIAAWILYAAVSGIVTATLSGANGTAARLLHIFAAMLSVSAFALLSLGAAILIASESEKYGMATYRICAWPLIAAGIFGFGLNIRLGIKTKKRAQALLKPTPESVLNSPVLDAKP